MIKKATIVIRLVEESVDRANKEIENEIFKKLSNTRPQFLGWKKLKKSR